MWLDSRQGSENEGVLARVLKHVPFCRPAAGCLFVLCIPDPPAVQLSPVQAQGSPQPTECLAMSSASWERGPLEILCVLDGGQAVLGLGCEAGAGVVYSYTGSGERHPGAWEEEAGLRPCLSSFSP